MILTVVEYFMILTVIIWVAIIICIVVLQRDYWEHFDEDVLDDEDDSF